MRRLPVRLRLSREQLYVFGPALLVSILAFLVALRFVSPAPPRHIVLATGTQDGSYHDFGLRYQALLAREGIAVDVRLTSGSVENVRLLKTPSTDIDVAFVQGGVLAAEDAGHLLSLGTLYLEPIWIFSRVATSGLDVAGLAGKRVAVGPDGSGTRLAAELLLNANGLSASSTPRIPVTSRAAQEGLQNGTVDAAVFVASPHAPMVRDILRVPGIQVMSFPRAEAYARQFPFLVKLVLPEGALSLASNTPPRDTVLLGAAVNLVIRDDLHPALRDLLLMSATTIHSGPGLFERPRQFPSPDHVDAPLSPEARRYYQSGPSFLHRYLPFWVATSVDRLKVMLLPLIALLFPLFKMVPPLYRWRVRSKIYCWYRDLDIVDRALANRPTPAEITRLEEDIERVEREVRGVNVPASYREELYDLRVHIEMLRSKVRAPAGDGTVQKVEVSDESHRRRH